MPPLENAAARITKKPFGIKVSPQNSPVQPERFSGYHTAVDFEIFTHEQESDVAVSAICDGKILAKRTLNGYGGVLIQSCQLENQAVTVLYGHIQLNSIQPAVGDTLKAGEKFSVLGAAFSSDTGGERKHLHLGIKKGKAIDFRGYVQNQAELQGWIDFETLAS